MTLSERLASESAFSVDAARAADFLQTADGKGPDPADLTDFHEPGGPLCRAATICAHSDDHTAATPLLDARSELVDEMTHPEVVEVEQRIADLCDELRDETNPFAQSKLRAEIAEARTERSEVSGEIGQLLSRIDRGEQLDARQLSTLLNREIEPHTTEITGADGQTYRADVSPDRMEGTFNEGVGSSALWAASTARSLYQLLPIRLLRSTALDMAEREREMSIGQHVAAIGVETLKEADPHFGSGTDQPADESEVTANAANGRNPRRETRPTFETV